MIDEITRQCHLWLGRRKVETFQSHQRSGTELGVATGLSTTTVGGTSFGHIQEMEAVTLPGAGHISITGSFGEVMKESAHAAITVARKWSLERGFSSDHLDIHVHAPAASVPKDGPSGGLAMAVAVASAITQTPVRRDVAATGEVNLRGQVLPVGGLVEKAAAAFDAGISYVLTPTHGDTDGMDRRVLKCVTLLPVAGVPEALDLAIAHPGNHEMLRERLSAVAHVREREDPLTDGDLIYQQMRLGSGFVLRERVIVDKFFGFVNARVPIARITSTAVKKEFGQRWQIEVYWQPGSAALPTPLAERQSRTALYILRGGEESANEVRTLIEELRTR